LARLLDRVPSQSRTIALLIVLIAVCAGLGSWRASVWAGRAADLEQRAAQERILFGQIKVDIAGEVAHRRSVAAGQRARLDSAVDLEAEAQALRRTAPAQSRDRYLRAQEERAVAASSKLEVRLPYDPELDRQTREDINSDLRDLRPDELSSASDAAQAHKVRLVVIYILLVVGIVALTFALLNDGRIRRALTGAGIVVAAVGLTFFALQAVVA
jgi:hypothetical protein